MYSKVGKVYSTITATIMIERYKCETILFSGVAGGISKSVQIGDIVLAQRGGKCPNDPKIVKRLLKIAVMRL